MKFLIISSIRKIKMEKQIRRKVRVLQFNTGGEYTNDLFLNYCRKEGIKHYFIVRKTPQQNDMSKLMSHILLENVWCMLSNFGLTGFLG